MATTYFLGAGTSAADGLPLMRDLNLGVAACIHDESPDELVQFYADLYGVRHEALARDGAAWKRYLCSHDLDAFKRVQSALPDLIETLSLVDVCIADEQSLGPSRRQAPGTGSSDFSPMRLRVVRNQLTMAIGRAVEDATSLLHVTLSQRFVAHLAPDDVIVSTNWDMLMDHAIVAGARPQRGPLTRAPIRYHCVGERPVDVMGDDIERAGLDARTLLKLHGGLNWFGCICCGNVYVNLEGSFTIDFQDPRPDFDICHFGAQLQNVMVAPSFVKDYRNVSLRSVWHEAQKRLENSRRWVFIGYSLPSDDYHIRAMLMRAMRTRLNSGRDGDNELEIIAVMREGDIAQARYQDMFRLLGCECRTTGFEAFITTMERETRS